MKEQVAFVIFASVLFAGNMRECPSACFSVFFVAGTSEAVWCSAASIRVAVVRTRGCPAAVYHFHLLFGEFDDLFVVHGVTFLLSVDLNLIVPPEIDP